MTIVGEPVGGVGSAPEELAVRRVAAADLPTASGVFRVVGYREVAGEEHVALVHGAPRGDGVLVRVHAECLTGDALGSARCDCGAQLQEAMRRIVAAGAGVVVYLRAHDGRTVGLLDGLRSYAVQDEGSGLVAAIVSCAQPLGASSSGAAAAILAELGVTSVRLLTSDPSDAAALDGAGVVIDTLVPLVVDRLGHCARTQTAASR